MPHTELLTARLIRLRRSYTGRTQSAVVPEVQSGLQRLDSAERGQLIRATRAPVEDVPLSPRVRAAVIPEAANRSQQQLEAAILAAASRVAFTQPKVFWAVRPRPDELILHVQPEALRSLLRELLPREHDGGLHGVPGLRVRLHRRHVELYSFGVDAPTSISLAGIGYRRFIDVLEATDADREVDDPLRWRGQDPQPLRPAEVERLHEAAHAPLASAVLRRIQLFPVFPR